MRILVLGAGRMGAAAAFDLARCGDLDGVTLADADPRRLRAAAGWIRTASVAAAPPHAAALPRLKTARVDVSNSLAVQSLMRGHAVVLSAVPYFHNLELTRSAILAGCHFCDLGGNTAIVRRQLALGAQAKRRGLAILPDCGLSPGMASILGGAAARRLRRPKSLRIFIGGLPLDPRPPLNYKLVFSVEGLINEYVEPCRILRNGRISDVEPLTEIEPIAFSGWPPLETMMTSGGTSTMPETFGGVLTTIEEKTIRYRGHTAIVKALKDLGFFSPHPERVGDVVIAPRVLSARLLARGLDLPGDDAVLLRIVAEGAGEVITYEADIRPDHATGMSAMARTTALPAAICARFLANGKISARGGLRQEMDVPPEPFIAELRLRGVLFRVRRRATGAGRQRARTRARIVKTPARQSSPVLLPNR
jgi:lysine 6-dehydrogenase